MLPVGLERADCKCRESIERRRELGEELGPAREDGAIESKVGLDSKERRAECV